MMSVLNQFALKVVALVGLPAIAAFAAMQWHVANEQAAQLDDQSRVWLRGRARDAANYISARLALYEEMTKQAAWSVAVLSNGDPGSVTFERMHSLLEHSLEDLPEATEMALGFLPGVYRGRQRAAPSVVRSGSELHRSDFAQRMEYIGEQPQAWRRVLDNKALWGDIGSDTKTGKLLLRFFYPVLSDSHGDVVGAMWTGVPLSAMSRLLPPRDGAALEPILVGHDGRILLHPVESWLGQTLSDVGLFYLQWQLAQVDANPSSDALGVDYLDAAGRPSWAAVASVPGVDWRVIAPYDEQDQAAAVDAMQHELRLYFVLALGFGLLAAFMTARALAAPIVSLEAAAKRIVDGDLGTPVDVAGRDVVGRLALAFSSMRRALVDRERELFARRSELEHRLIQREFLAEIEAAERHSRDDLRGALEKVAQTMAVESVVGLQRPMHVRIVWLNHRVQSRGFIDSPAPLIVSTALHAGGQLAVELHIVSEQGLVSGNALHESSIGSLAKQVCERLASIVDGNV